MVARKEREREGKREREREQDPIRCFLSLGSSAAEDYAWIQ
jgi:hypothetical protein